MRTITLAGEIVGYSKKVFSGKTDTGKNVYIAVFALDSNFGFPNSLTIGIRYTTDDKKRDYNYDSSLGWKNQYIITPEELTQIKEFAK